MRPYQRTRISCVLLQSSWIREKAQQYPVLGRILVGGNFSDKQWKNDWGYHLIRSKFAVASGGATGYGFRQGPFVKYNFLPERHNDFIFAIIAHQWGFWGCLVVLGLYVIVGACGLEIAAHNTDPYGRLACRWYCRNVYGRSYRKCEYDNGPDADYGLDFTICKLRRLKSAGKYRFHRSIK